MKNKLKKGDKCVMHSCGEASFPQYHGRIWTCGDYGMTKNSIFLEGFSGSFSMKFLQKVNIQEKVNEAHQEKAIRNKPHCWGKMDWILKYKEGEEPRRLLYRFVVHSFSVTGMLNGFLTELKERVRKEENNPYYV